MNLKSILLLTIQWQLPSFFLLCYSFGVGGVACSHGPRFRCGGSAERRQQTLPNGGQSGRVVARLSKIKKPNQMYSTVKETNCWFTFFLLMMMIIIIIFFIPFKTFLYRHLSRISQVKWTRLYMWVFKYCGVDRGENELPTIEDVCWWDTLNLCHLGWYD